MSLRGKEAVSELLSQLIYCTRIFIRRIQKRDRMGLGCYAADHDRRSSLPPATLRDAVCCTETLATAEVNIDN